MISTTVTTAADNDRGEIIFVPRISSKLQRFILLVTNAMHYVIVIFSHKKRHAFQGTSVEIIDVFVLAHITIRNLL